MENNHKSMARIASRKLAIFWKLRSSDFFHFELDEAEKLQSDWILDDLIQDICSHIDKIE